MLLRIALGLALFETLVLAGVLLAWARQVRGARWLALFLVGVAVWITGNELPNWFGAHPPAWAQRLAMHLLATAPLTSVVFLHFCVVFCRVPLAQAALGAAYTLGAGAMLVAQVLLPAHWRWHPDVGWLAVADTTGVLASLVWVLMAVAGVAVLLRAWAGAAAPARQQIAAVSLSCLWGLACLMGYAIALLDWPVYPFPLLALPAYPVILVYGVLRYGVFVANVWAGRALAWTLLLALGLGVVAVLPLVLPFESRWLSGLAVAAACLAMVGPVRAFAQRLVYPGAVVAAEDLAAWRRALAGSESGAMLAQRATQLLSARLGVAVAVHCETEAASTATTPAAPVLRLQLSEAVAAPGDAGGPREPSLAFEGWQAAPPGQRRVAELFGSVLLDAAAQLQQAQALAARERERQLQARLAELGGLAATVAHDIRNPLNIIGMAVALGDADTRREVQTQVQRIARLADDLLDYAKPWQLEPRPADLVPLLQALAARDPGLRLGPLPAALTLVFDGRRIEQALVNLLDNARAAAGTAERALLVEADEEAVNLRVCDQGSGIPPEWRERVFEPFASRSTGGTGLGLAIVARVAQAHGGRVWLEERAGWRTCFTLRLPRQRPEPAAPPTPGAQP